MRTLKELWRVQNFQQNRVVALVFSVGILLALSFTFVPSLHQVIIGLQHFGYFGVFISGALYSSTLMSATATVVLVASSDTLHPLLVGVVGGLGAVLFDTIFFLIGRRESRQGPLARFVSRINARRHIPSWAVLVLGGLVLASPLPDELAAGLLGATNGKLIPFLTLSFACNAVGIMILHGIAAR